MKMRIMTDAADDIDSFFIKKFLIFGFCDIIPIEKISWTIKF